MSLYHPRVLQVNTIHDLRAALQKVGAELSLWRDLVDQGMFRAVIVEGIPYRLARFLYQELTLEGGQVALPTQMDDYRSGLADVLLLGTRYQLQHLVIRVRTQSDDELAYFADELEQALAAYDGIAHDAVTIRGTRFDWGTRTYIMERLVSDLVTQDSGDPECTDILYVDRVNLAQVRAQTNVPIASTIPIAANARVALDAGADMIVITSAHAEIDQAIRDLDAQIELRHDAGIVLEKIIVDTGAVDLNRIGELRVLGAPILFDMSREPNAEAQAALVALGIARGTDIVCGRDVKQMARVVKTVDAVVRKRGK
jgi:hypothetical protein